MEPWICRRSPSFGPKTFGAMQRPSGHRWAVFSSRDTGGRSGRRGYDEWRIRSLEVEGERHRQRGPAKACDRSPSSAHSRSCLRARLQPRGSCGGSGSPSGRSPDERTYRGGALGEEPRTRRSERGGRDGNAASSVRARSAATASPQGGAGVPQGQEEKKRNEKEEKKKKKKEKKVEKKKKRASSQGRESTEEGVDWMGARQDWPIPKNFAPCSKEQVSTQRIGFAIGLPVERGGT